MSFDNNVVSSSLSFDEYLSYYELDAQRLFKFKKDEEDEESDEEPLAS